MAESDSGTTKQSMRFADDSEPGIPVEEIIEEMEHDPSETRAPSTSGRQICSLSGEVTSPVMSDAVPEDEDTGWVRVPKGSCERQEQARRVLAAFSTPESIKNRKQAKSKTGQRSSLNGKGKKTDPEDVATDIEFATSEEEGTFK